MILKTMRRLAQTPALMEARSGTPSFASTKNDNLVHGARNVIVGKHSAGFVATQEKWKELK
jgi:hypothetical protein